MINILSLPFIFFKFSHTVLTLKTKSVPKMEQAVIMCLISVKIGALRRCISDIFLFLAKTQLTNYDVKTTTCCN